MSGHLSQKDIFEADDEVWKNKKSKKATNSAISHPTIVENVRDVGFVK
jgi:hypothetical protein